MQTGEFRLHQNFRGNAELDGVEFVEAEDVLIEWRQGQLRDQIETACNAVGVGHDLVVGGGKLRAAGARTGIGVNSGILEGGVGGDVKREERGECASEAVRSEEHTSELQSRQYLVCRLLLE